MKLLVAKERKGRKKLKTAAKLFDAKIPDVDPFYFPLTFFLQPAGRADAVLKALEMTLSSYFGIKQPRPSV
ncbi:MAG: hypothetical protein IPK08_18710 [Bacteroidetes bacterium]|nr:hypothetical protein [Bacteroidota bacterium]